MKTAKAFAKINLTLDVVGKREDGYHLLETVMQTISLCDKIGVEKSDKIEILCDDPNVPKDERNICHKAAVRFFERLGISGGAKITIEKQIPSEAGLGGGSSDGAAVIKLLNEIYDAKLKISELEEIAGKVGADVAFFIQGGTALCRGAGEIITPLKPAPERYVLVLRPDFGVSTPLAYRLFDEKNIPSSCGTKKFMEQLEADGKPYLCLSNDLESALENEEIAKIRLGLMEYGAEAAQMTGSGSAVFGIYEKEETAMLAKKHFEKTAPFCRLCITI